MLSQPIPVPSRRIDAVEIATDLHRTYGDHAMAGAQSALRTAEKAGDPTFIDLWNEVCGILERKGL